MSARHARRGGGTVTKKKEKAVNRVDAAEGLLNNVN